MPSTLNVQSNPTCCITSLERAASCNIISRPAVDGQTTSEATVTQSPAAAVVTDMQAVVTAAPPAEGALCISRDSAARQQSEGLATLMTAIKSKQPAQAPAPAPPLPQQDPSEGYWTGAAPSVPCIQTGMDRGDADQHQVACKDTLTARRLVGESAGVVPMPVPAQASCRHSQLPREGKQAAPATQENNITIKAADTDTLTHMIDTQAESAALEDGGFEVADADTPSSKDNHQEIAHNTAELFCMVSDKDSQEDHVASASLQLDASSSHQQAIGVADLHNSHCQDPHDSQPQLEPSGSQHQNPLTASPQHPDIIGHLPSSVAIWPQRSVLAYQQDAQCLAEAAPTTLARMHDDEDEEQAGQAQVSDGQAAQQLDMQEGENRLMQSVIAPGRLSTPGAWRAFGCWQYYSSFPLMR